VPDNEDILARLERLEKLAVQPPRPERAVGMGGLIVSPGLGLPKWVENSENEKLKARAGLGASGPDPSSDMYCEVWEMLSLSSPRLALAKALGAKFIPFTFNVRADFTSTDTTLVPDVGSDTKIVQDTLVDAAILQITNQSNVANLSVFQPQSDFFYVVQSGIECIVSIQGAPRPTIVEKYTPLANVFDTQKGYGFWPRKWVLTNQQQLFMSFQATVTLPYAPLDVCITFRSWVPAGEGFSDISNREALDRLANDCGIVVSDAYRTRILST